MSTLKNGEMNWSLGKGNDDDNDVDPIYKQLINEPEIIQIIECSRKLAEKGYEFKMVYEPRGQCAGRKTIYQFYYPGPWKVLITPNHNDPKAKWLKGYKIILKELIATEKKLFEYASRSEKLNESIKSD